MVCNITYEDKRQEREISELVGRSYTVWQSIKMGGTGSQKLIIEETDEIFTPFLKQRNSTKYCNIELRPRGIGLRFRYKLEAIGWFVPYTDLEYDWDAKSLNLRDKNSGEFMRLKPTQRASINEKFMKKLEGLSSKGK